MKPGVAGGVLVAATLFSSAASADAPGTTGGRATSISEAVAIALRDNPDSQTGEVELRGAEADRAGVQGGFGPRLHVDANLQQWNSPFTIAFSPPGVTAPPFTVRDAFTWTASVSIIQPLTPLWSIYDQYKVQDLGVDVAALKRKVTRREIAFQVTQAYYRLLEASRLAEVAQTSVTQLEGQQRQAKSLFDNGVVGKNDLLRAGLALANAQQRAIQMRGNVSIARGQLDTALGRPPGAAFEAEPFVGDPPPLDEPSVESAEQHASAQRLEARELDRSIEQADHGVAAAQKKLIPQVNAVGNYTHVEGAPFQQLNAAYVGLFASWDVWDWGTTTSGISSARAKLDAARIARRKIDDAVQLEARQAFVNAETARDALGVARTAVSQAEENFRIVSKKFENAAATSFDVVDAESLLTQARGQVETALYDLLIARAALARATGAPLPGSP
ncbi:MAG TPA: TolC family protein [Polyangiaceae bacterium]